MSMYVNMCVSGHTGHPYGGRGKPRRNDLANRSRQVGVHAANDAKRSGFRRARLRVTFCVFVDFLLRLHVEK